MNDMEKAVEILNKGGIIIFPTDTAFGIGCRIDNEKAIKKLFELRKRPFTQAAPVLVDSIEMGKEYLEEIPSDVEDLMSKYWPGALTIVYQCKINKVPSLVRGGGNTLGVRMPNHSVVLQILKEVGVPVLGPSANFHGEKTPYKLEDLDSNLVQKVDFVVQGDTSEGNVSTVLDVSEKPWKILREGAVKLSL